MSGRLAQPFERGSFDRLLGRPDVPMPRAPRWNIGPPDPILAVHADPDGRALILPGWGFLAPWEKDPRQVRIKPITAKLETVASSRLFAAAYQQHRVLVPVVAWYAWRPVSAELRQPYAFGRGDGGVVTLGGIVSVPRSRRSAAGLSIAIITRPAPATLSAVQDRVPLVIADADHALWLGEAPGELDGIADRAVYEAIDCWPVSRRVNRPGSEGAELLQPVGTDPLVATADVRA